MNNSIKTNYKIVPKILDALVYCTSKEEVERIFAESNINDPKDKKDFLQMCMEFEEVFDLPLNEELSDEDKYKDELAVFLEGSWRLLVT